MDSIRRLVENGPSVSSQGIYKKKKMNNVYIVQTSGRFNPTYKKN